MLSRPFALLIGLCVLLLSELSRADPPALTSATPRGLQRGQSATLTLSGPGVGLSEPEILSRVPGTLGELKVESDDRVQVSLTIPVDAPLGAYPIRVRTPHGLTAPLLIAVDDLPQLAETEPNDSPESAQSLTLPVTVEGTASGTDQDVFRVSGQQGESMVIEVEARRLGSALEPSLTVLDTRGLPIASNVDALPLDRGDLRLALTLPADGDYFLVLNDLTFGAGPNAFYRLKVGQFPTIDAIFPLGWSRGDAVDVQFLGGDFRAPLRVRIETPEDLELSWLTVAPPVAGPVGQLPFRFVLSDGPEQLEPDNEGPHPLPIGSVMNGRLDEPGEVDQFQVLGQPGEALRFEIEAARLGSPLDAVLKLTRPDGSTLAQADDAEGLDPALTFTVPDDVSEVIVSVEDLLRRGGPAFAYRLSARRVEADYSIHVATPAVSIPQGAITIVPVKIVRRNFNDAIQLSIPSDMPGVTASGGLIPARANEGTILLSAEPGAEPGLVPLEIWGTAGPPARPLRRQARLESDGTPLDPLRPRELPAAIALGPALKVSASADSLTFLHGGQAELTVKVERPEGHEHDIAIRTAGLPNQVSGGNANIEGDQTETTLTFNVDSLAPLGPATLLLTANTKVDGRDQTIQLPPISARVEHPYQLEVLNPSLTIAPGSKGIITGLIRRVSPFAQEVRVGLGEGSAPPNVEVAEVAVGPEEALVQVEVTVGPDAAPGTFTLPIVAATEMPGRRNTKDYVLPDAPVQVTIEPASLEPVAD